MTSVVYTFLLLKRL